MRTGRTPSRSGGARPRGGTGTRPRASRLPWNSLPEVDDGPGACGERAGPLAGHEAREEGETVRSATEEGIRNLALLIQEEDGVRALPAPGPEKLGRGDREKGLWGPQPSAREVQQGHEVLRELPSLVEV